MFIFHKPWNAFKAKVYQELNRLIDEGIIVKVNNSLWGTPFVLVLKSNGAVRIFTDYKVTVNRYLENFQHSISKFEKLFL